LILGRSLKKIRSVSGWTSNLAVRLDAAFLRGELD
jgi:hypothetical protein